MIGAALGASIASQLYQSLTQKASAASDASATSFTQAADSPPQGRPSGPPPSGSAEPNSSVSSIDAATAKVISDLKALLLGTQELGSPTSAPRASAETSRPSAASDSSGSTSALDQVTNGLANLLGPLGRSPGHHQRQGPSPAADVSATPTVPG